MASESTSLPSKAIEVDTQVSEEVVNEVEEISVDSVNIEVPIAINNSIDNDIGSVTINTEDTTLVVNESEIETTPTNILPSSTITPPEIQVQNADITNISEDPILLKKTTEEETVKSGNKLIFVY